SDLTAVLARPGLGDSDGGDLRPAVRARRHVAVIDWTRILARDRLGGDHAFGHGLVGQQGRPGHVTDGVDALHRRLHPRRDLDEPAVERDAERLQSDALHAGGAADGHEHLLGLEATAVGLDDDAGAAGFHGLYFHARLARDVAAGERARAVGGDLFVLDRDESGPRLEDRPRPPVPGIDLGELAPDGTGADDDQPLRF